MGVVDIKYADSKPKKTAKELVEMLSEEKGITFSCGIGKEEAVEYLTSVNNYLRTASYRKNYPKHTSGPNEGKYIGLDFRCLTELSTIDMHLRSILLKMCIDVEHALKVKLITAFSIEPTEDAYEAVRQFISSDGAIQKSIAQKSNSVFTGNLIKKYFDLKPIEEGSDRVEYVDCDCPVWVFMELLDFGRLISFIRFCYNRNPNLPMIAFNTLNPVRSLRNACAHNNCLLYDLSYSSETKPPRTISSFVANMTNIPKETRRNKLTCRPLFEITCLLYEYQKWVSPKVYKNGMLSLQKFVDERMYRNIDLFKNNGRILTSFEYINKMVDNLADSCI